VLNGALVGAVVAAGLGYGVTLPRATASEAPKPMVELAGRVAHGTSTGKRRIQVQTGPLEVTLHVDKKARIDNKGKSISVHDVKSGTYVWARGSRIGNTRVEATDIIVVGDRHDFLNSKYGKVAGEKGYIHPMTH
jgi:hypothetical protein